MGKSGGQRSQRARNPNRDIGFIPLHLAVPFTAPYRPLWAGLGTLTVYLGSALVASFYLRRWISRRTWRTLHFAAYLVFGLALAHGIMAGTDSGATGMRWMYVGTGAALLFATLVRVLTMRKAAAAAAAPAAKADKARSRRQDKGRFLLFPFRRWHNRAHVRSAADLCRRNK